jgi:hypothetical protein
MGGGPTLDQRVERFARAVRALRREIEAIGEEVSYASPSRTTAGMWLHDVRRKLGGIAEALDKRQRRAFRQRRVARPRRRPSGAPTMTRPAPGRRGAVPVEGP